MRLTMFGLGSFRLLMAALLIVIANGFGKTATAELFDCPGGTLVPGTNKCLKFFNSVWLTFERAVQSCQEKGMYLTEVQSHTHNKLLRKIVPHGHVAWIGLSDQVVEGTFAWNKSGSSLRSRSYQKWAKDQPDDWKKNQDCVVFSHHHSAWDDTFCHWSYPYICEEVKTVNTIKSGHSIKSLNIAKSVSVPVSVNTVEPDTAGLLQRQYICTSNLYKYVKVERKRNHGDASKDCKDRFNGDLPKPYQASCVAKALAHFNLEFTMSTQASHGNTKVLMAEGTKWMSLSKPWTYMCEVVLFNNRTEFGLETLTDCNNGYELYQPYGTHHYTPKQAKLACTATGGSTHSRDCNKPPHVHGTICSRQVAPVKYICSVHSHQYQLVQLPRLKDTWYRNEHQICDKYADGWPPRHSWECIHLARYELKIDTDQYSYLCELPVRGNDLKYSGSGYSYPENHPGMTVYKPINGKSCASTGGVLHHGKCRRRDHECNLRYDKICYKLFSTKETFDGAITICKMWGGSLVRIYNAHINNNLRKAARGGKYWIGLRKTNFYTATERIGRVTRHGRQHVMRWTIGGMNTTNNGYQSPQLNITFVINYGPGKSDRYVSPEGAFQSFAGYKFGVGSEPNGDRREICICSQGNGWHDRSCNTQLQFVCQRDE